MKFWKIFRFEFTYQVRRITTWLYFTALAVVAFLFVRGNFLADALYADFFLNSPFVIAVVTVFCGLFWLLIAGSVTGEIAARDTETGMHPLSYTTPVSKAEYLGGRFLAAFLLHALILLAVPVGITLSVYSPGVDAEVIGPFRPAAYLTAYFFLALPNAFIGTAIQFAWTALGRRAIGGYLGSVCLFAIVYGGIFMVFYFGGQEDLALLLDALAHLTIFDITMGWTPIEKSIRLIELKGSVLWSRLLWLGIAAGTLGFTYLRFRFTHHTASSLWSRLFRRRIVQAPAPAGSDIDRSTITIPKIRRTFGYATYMRQMLAIARTSFRTIALNWGGMILMVFTGALTVLIVPEHLENMGTPLRPMTGYLLTFLTTPLTNFFTPWVIIPLAIVLYSGELVWRERKSGLAEITDAAPVPEWVYFLGKFIGLSLILVAWMTILTLAGLLIQVRLGYYNFEISLYLKILFGLQLPEYLLFALLALVVHGLIGQKYIGHMTALLIYAFIMFATWLGVRHHLLVYGSGPGWTYNDMRGFGLSLEPWMWFKLYWPAWALLLAVLSKLLWVRGLEGSLRVRLQQARNRFTRPTARVAAASAGLLLILGSYIFYNTNVLNEYSSATEWLERSAEYEKLYGKFRDRPQPRLTATRLHVEIYPEQREAEIRGSFRLVNNTAETIDTIHLATIRKVHNGPMTFDRKAKLAIADDDHGHRSYVLEKPLQPGDSVQLSFEVSFKPEGFRNNGIDPYVVENGTYFTNELFLPAIGYQPRRELIKPGERRAYGLAQRPLIPTLEDAGADEDITGEADHGMNGNEHVSFEAVVGTSEGQTAVAPGALRRTWTEGGRRYFHYATERAIGGEYAFFSANYALYEGKWNVPDGSGRVVPIQIYHHPGHKANLDRIFRSVRASLDHYSRQYGPYPFGYIRLVENPIRKMGAHADVAMIDYGQGFALFDPANDPRGLDFPFAIIAHEVAHQWWGAQLSYAPIEGAGLLTESPAWYSAMGVVEETYGREHLRRLMRFFRQPYPIKPIRQSEPLLRGKDPYAAYRKGPFALFAMSEYMGKDRVDLAYRRLLEKHRSGAVPLPTSLDLYRELQAVTPDTLRYLLHDLFEANTFWELKTRQATAKQTKAGNWEVTLNVQARKVVVDPDGKETEVPMNNEWIEIGVFAPTGEGADFGKTLYLRKHRIRSGQQTITVTVKEKPSDAGIDPYHLLIEEERFDNVEEVRMEG